jgi:hypothetical protein
MQKQGSFVIVIVIVIVEAFAAFIYFQQWCRTGSIGRKQNAGISANIREEKCSDTCHNETASREET